MKFCDMKPGTRYVVTKPSDDGTFTVGEHVKINSDGAISCNEGWVEPSDVAEAVVGMEVEIDIYLLISKLVVMQTSLDEIDDALTVLEGQAEKEYNLPVYHYRIADNIEKLLDSLQCMLQNTK